MDRLTGSISAQKSTLQINGLCIIYAFVLFPWQPPEAGLAGGSSPFYREQEWVWHQEGLWPQGLLTWGSVSAKQRWVGTGKGGSHDCQNPARMRLGRGAWGVEKVGGLPSHPATCGCEEWHAGDGNGVDSLQERKGCLSPPLSAFLPCWLSFLPSLLAWELNIKALKSVSLHWNLRALPLKANVWMVGGTWSTVKSEGDLGRLGWLRRMCQHALQWVCPCVCRAVCMPVWVCVCGHMGVRVWQEGKWAAFSYQDEQESGLRPRTGVCSQILVASACWAEEMGHDMAVGWLGSWLVLDGFGSGDHTAPPSALRSVSHALFGHPFQKEWKPFQAQASQAGQLSGPSTLFSFPGPAQEPNLASAFSAHLWVQFLVWVLGVPSPGGLLRTRVPRLVADPDSAETGRQGHGRFFWLVCPLS